VSNILIFIFFFALAARTSSQMVPNSRITNSNQTSRFVYIDKLLQPKSFCLLPLYLPVLAWSNLGEFLFTRCSSLSSKKIQDERELIQD
jgi:hypothetical protein